MASDTSWMRHREGMGVWEHRGKVAVVGWGQSHMDRRWDGVTMDRSCGGLSKEACLKAIADAGLSLDDIDGLITSPETRAEQTWAPRPYFAPPYDTEDGLTKASAEWIQRELGFKSIKYIKSDAQPRRPVRAQQSPEYQSGDPRAERLYPAVGVSERRDVQQSRHLPAVLQKIRQIP